MILRQAAPWLPASCQLQHTSDFVDETGHLHLCFQGNFPEPQSKKIIIGDQNMQAIGSGQLIPIRPEHVKIKLSQRSEMVYKK
jgi:hypothetical protein